MQRSQVGASENSRTCEDEHNETGEGTKFRILYDLSPIPLSKKNSKKEEIEQERQKKTNCDAKECPHKHEKERDFKLKKWRFPNLFHREREKEVLPTSLYRGRKVKISTNLSEIHCVYCVCVKTCLLEIHELCHEKSKNFIHIINTPSSH